MRWTPGLILAGVAIAGVCGWSGKHDADTLLNVSCDPTRELWKDLNEEFIKHFEEQHGWRPTIRVSHGGSSSQALS